jgi:thymidylate synthase (FAD)
MEVELIRITGGCEDLIENAARVCYGSEYKGDPVFIRKLIEKGHESIIEHCVATFRINHISRVTSHQLVRHRIASYSQRSQRYYKNKLEFIYPQGISDEQRDIIGKSYEESLMKYGELIEGGMSQDEARYVLPNGLSTEIIMTMNFRSLRNFFKLRLSPKASNEMQILAKLMFKLVYPYAKSVFGDLKGEQNEQNR